MRVSRRFTDFLVRLSDTGSNSPTRAGMPRLRHKLRARADAQPVSSEAGTYCRLPGTPVASLRISPLSSAVVKSTSRTPSDFRKFNADYYCLLNSTVVMSLHAENNSTQLLPNHAIFYLGSPQKSPQCRFPRIPAYSRLRREEMLINQQDYSLDEGYGGAQ